MIYLCPWCLAPGPFSLTTTNEGEKYWQCSATECGMDTIPLRYTQEYDRHPPIPFTLIGGTGQGKTRFLNALFGQIRWLQDEAPHWPGFISDPLSTAQFDRMLQMLSDYEAGAEEQGSVREDTPNPIIVRYRGIPRVGGCQLIFFDNAGEAFDESATTFRITSGFMKRSPALIWTVSLRDRDLTADDPHRITDYAPNKLLRILSNYLEAMATIGGSPKDHTLILTLTKGERLVPLPGFPESAKRVLHHDLFNTPDPWAALEAVSDDLLGWLLTTPYRGLLHRVRSEFKAVRVCVVSAQGREYDPNEPPRPFEPKAVLSPLLWLWRADRPAVSVERNGVSTVYLSAADAFAAVGPGAKVHLGRGEHVLDAPAKLHGPLTVSGDDPEHTFLVGVGTKPKEEYVLGVGGGGEVRLSGLTVERRGGTGGDVVRVMNGRLVAERVRFRGGKELDEKSPVGSGLVVGRGGTAAARGCQFLDNARCGVWAFTANGDKVELTDCAARGNRHGLWVTGAGNAVADNCTWERNRYGIRVSEQGRAEVRGGSAGANRKDGVQVDGDGRAVLVDFTSAGNTGNGAEFGGAGGGSVSGGRFGGNANGIVVTGQGRVQVTGADTSDNRVDGFQFDGTGGGTVSGGTSGGNGGWGFQLLGEVSVDATGVAARGNTSGPWTVAKTVPKLTRVADCGPGRDDRPKKGLFG